MGGTFTAAACWRAAGLYASITEILCRGLILRTSRPAPTSDTSEETAADSATGRGRLPGARWCPSPNFGPRPDPDDVSVLIVHNISLPPGQFEGDAIERFFCNRLPAHEHPYFRQISELQVSAHALIRRDGEVIQFVDLQERAWHAGRSLFDGREECNDFSIGVELEGTDELAYTDAQYQSLTRVAMQVMQRWPAVTPQRITGHSDVAPGRKTDPGPAFDWSRLHSLLREADATADPGSDC